MQAHMLYTCIHLAEYYSTILKTSIHDIPVYMYMCMSVAHNNIHVHVYTHMHVYYSTDDTETHDSCQQNVLTNNTWCNFTISTVVVCRHLVALLGVELMSATGFSIHYTHIHIRACIIIYVHVYVCNIHVHQLGPFVDFICDGKQLLLVALTCNVNCQQHQLWQALAWRNHGNPFM